MAEAGLTLAIFGSFNTALQYFEYAYLPKIFDRDLETAQLKLDVARLQLSRWGRTVGLDRFDETRPSLSSSITASPDECRTAEKLLTNIVKLFEETESKSAKLASRKDASASTDPPADLSASTLSLHQRFNKLSLKTLKPMVKKTRWALFSGRHVRRLVEDITDEVDSLAKLFPATQPAQEELYQEEARELGSDEHVSVLEPWLGKQDPKLSAAIKEARETAPQMNQTSFERSINYQGLQLGQNYAAMTNNFGAGSQDSRRA